MIALFFQAGDGIRDGHVTGVQTCALPISTVVIRAYGILSGILDDAVKDNLLSRNPADGVEMPRKRKNPNVYLTHEQVHRLAGESAHPDIVLILSYCG